MRSRPSRSACTSASDLCQQTPSPDRRCGDLNASVRLLSANVAQLSTSKSTVFGRPGAAAIVLFDVVEFLCRLLWAMAEHYLPRLPSSALASRFWNTPDTRL
jgi:hypothetical protein